MPCKQATNQIKIIIIIINSLLTVVAFLLFPNSGIELFLLFSHCMYSWLCIALWGLQTTCPNPAAITQAERPLQASKVIAHLGVNDVWASRGAILFESSFGLVESQRDNKGGVCRMLVFCLLTGQYVVCAIDSLFPTSCSVCLQCWEHYFLICKHPLLSNSCGTPGGAREV